MIGQRFRIVLLFIGLMAASNSLKASAATICENPRTTAFICMSMHHLLSHALILETQKDLVQVNYPLLEAIGGSVERFSSSLLTQRLYSVHLENIEGLRTVAQDLSSKAARENPNSFKTANLMKQNCLSCHSPNTSPGAPDSYEGISRLWGDERLRCNELGKNPYVCKHMHGLSDLFQIFDTSLFLSDLDFRLVELVSEEIARISSNLMVFKEDIHPGSKEIFKALHQESLELVELARKEDQMVILKSQDLRQRCQSCHEHR
jgi:hypothetical protein